MLSEMDSFDVTAGVVVITATNRIDVGPRPHPTRCITPTTGFAHLFYKVPPARACPKCMSSSADSVYGPETVSATHDVSIESPHITV
jgi:hypothetical protein